MRQSRWVQIREQITGALWVLPVVASLLAAGLGSILSLVNLNGTFLEPLLFQGDAAEARVLMRHIATTIVGVIALVIGLTVVALQVAANRYSPRLLRNFLRDRTTQFVLSIFVATFVYNAAGLYTVGFYGDDIPRLAISIGLGLVLVCLLSFVYFVDHMVHSIQIDTVIAKTGRASAASLTEEPPGVGRAAGEAVPQPPKDAAVIPSRRSGYVQHIDLRVVERLAVADAVVRLAPSIGDHLVSGSPLARVWGSTSGAKLDHERVSDELWGAISIGFERTAHQDVELGLQQIVDIALLSIHIKDFYTAVQAANELTILLCKLATKPLGTEGLHDDNGTVRLIVPARSFEDYLDLACGEMRRFGSNEPLVVRALLRMLREVGGVLSDAERRAAVAVQIGAVVADAERGIAHEIDLVRVRADAEAALAAVAD